MHSDPIADMCTRIRNAVAVEKGHVDVPFSAVKNAVGRALQAEGFIWDCEDHLEGHLRVLRLSLKYGPNGEPLIRAIKRVSKPGRRVYVQASELKTIRNGTGVAIISTSRGILSSREAKEKNLGGELLAEVW